MKNQANKSRWLLAVGLALMMGLVHAHGPRGGHYHYRYWGPDPWLAPLVVGTAMVGTAVYFSRPYPPMPPSTVVITSPPVVVLNTPAPAAAPIEAYYCRESAQYFPVVQTCPSPWQVVYSQP